jgi:hypothetical protein
VYTKHAETSARPALFLDKISRHHPDGAFFTPTASVRIVQEPEIPDDTHQV